MYNTYRDGQNKGKKLQVMATNTSKYDAESNFPDFYTQRSMTESHLPLSVCGLCHIIVPIIQNNIHKENQKILHCLPCNHSQ